MIPWELIDTTKTPDQLNELRLYRRGDEFSIRIDGQELMNSRAHGSEEVLAEAACSRIAGRPRARVLIGGLGMGYTLAAALAQLGSKSQVVVSELAPAVVTWNRGPLGALAGDPLLDKRVSVQEVDVVALIKTSKEQFDAIILDVDNGPEALTQKGNEWLYGRSGLSSAHAALRPGGVLAVWAAQQCPPFAKRLRRVGFQVKEIRARSRGKGKGSRHTVWLAQRDVS